jgi:hypothetical protein
MDRIQIKLADGTVRQAVLPPGVGVTKRVLVPFTDIHPGDWVGVDSKPGADGAQESVAINVFSPSMTGKVRKGQFTMASGDLMTNAPVEKITSAGEAGGLVLKNDDAMVGIRIGKQTIVHRLLDAATTDLKSGLSVSVRGKANDDGSLQAASVTIVQS